MTRHNERRDERPERIATVAVHGGERRPGPEGSVVYPIYQGTVYSVPEGTDYHDIRYLRLSSTPTQSYLHDKLAALEGAEAALATASGMAAISSILVGLLKPGDHLLAGSCLYGGTYTLLREHGARFGIDFSLVDPSDPSSWEDALRPTTRLFLLETIANPLMRVPRFDAAVAFCKKHGILSVIDNTFATPVGFRPLDAGFDLVWHSATKYLNGHSDLVAGCLMGRRSLVDRVRHTLNHLGGTLDPHAAFLLARGVKTLAVRVFAQWESAIEIARFLEGHEAVAEVHYPGLETHPDHGEAAAKLVGFGGMLAFRLFGGAPALDRFLGCLDLPAVAPSLGGVESLITVPARTSHAGLSQKERLSMGVSDDLVRMSVGIEDPVDLIADLKQALSEAGRRDPPHRTPMTGQR